MASRVSLTGAEGRSAVVPASRPYFPALDGVRAFAFLLVFGLHYLALSWGGVGVDIFFVLSGFLITGILLDTREQPNAIRNFYIRRTLRIFPLYYAVILLVAAAYPAFHWRLTWGWLAWPLYVGNFTSNLHPVSTSSAAFLLENFEPLSANGHVRLMLAHCWSLCVEEQFYLVWPWVVFAVRDRKKLIVICVSAVVLCPCARALDAHFYPQFLAVDYYKWTPFRIDALLLGGLVALIERGSHRERLLQIGRVAFWALFSVAMLWIVETRRAHRSLDPSWHLTWGLLFVDILSAALIVSALHPSALTFKLFNLAPLKWLGRISYGAYLFHYIFYAELMALLVRLHVQHLARASSTIGLGLTVLLSWASYRWFETPFLRLKERWTGAP